MAHKSSWEEVMSGVLQGSFMGPVLLNIFINYLHDGIECPLRTFSCNKLGGIAYTLEGKARIQNDPCVGWRNGVQLIR